MSNDNFKDKKKYEHWCSQEESKFQIFCLLENRSFYNSKQRVQKGKFRLMSEFIGTRNASQCRTHFNRMIKERYQQKKRDQINQYLYCKIIESKDTFLDQINKKIDSIIKDKHYHLRNFQGKLYYLKDNLASIITNIQILNKGQQSQRYNLQSEKFQSKQQRKTQDFIDSCLDLTTKKTQQNSDQYFMEY